MYTGPSLSQLDQLIPIGPVLELCTLSCSSTHNNRLQVLQRTALNPTLPGPVCTDVHREVKEVSFKINLILGNNFMNFISRFTYCLHLLQKCIFSTGINNNNKLFDLPLKVLHSKTKIL